MKLAGSVATPRLRGQCVHGMRCKEFRLDRDAIIGDGRADARDGGIGNRRRADRRCGAGSQRSSHVPGRHLIMRAAPS
jgi:hypothetical protein